MPRRRLPKSILFRWCYLASEYLNFLRLLLWLLFYNDIDWTYLLLKASRVAGRKGAAYRLSPSIPRFSRVVWSVDWWVLSGNIRMNSLKCFCFTYIFYRSNSAGFNYCYGGIASTVVASGQTQVEHNWRSILTGSFWSHSRTRRCQKTNAGNEIIIFFVFKAKTDCFFAWINLFVGERNNVGVQHSSKWASGPLQRCFGARPRSKAVYHKEKWGWPRNHRFNKSSTSR